MTDTRATPFRYAAFGLTIASAFELPELSVGTDGPADLTIHRADIGHPKFSDEDDSAIDFTDERQVLSWKAVGTFVISDGGRRIAVEPIEGLDPRLISFPLLGPVMATCLHFRGCLVFHASAVSIHGEGVVLLGDKGAGKSTTASAIVSRGHPLLSDDVVAIRSVPGGGSVIEPAFGQVKLTESAARAVSINSSIEDQVHPAITKQMHRLRDGFSMQPTPPKAFYILDRGSDARIEPLDPADALSELLRFSYAARFGRAGLQGRHAARHLGQIASIVSGARVGRLVVPSQLERLAEAVALLEANHGDRPKTVSS